MARTSKLLTPEVVQKAKDSLAKLGKTGSVSIKLMAIIAAEKHGITVIARIFGTTKATLISWIKRLDHSPDQLKVQAGRGRKRLLGQADEALIRAWMHADPHMTIDRLRLKIETELKVFLARSTVHRLMKNLHFSYITPRPQHHKQDAELLEESKKKSDCGDWARP